MKLLKPIWVHHDEKPIFSVDVHQECLKFATGGQGLDSGRVVIWNLLPVLSEQAEQDDSVPKMLCQMDNHLACVNCVRWSQDGQTLASASDDKLVMIWRKSKGPSGVFGTGGIQKNPESWKCVASLRGHAGDVLDLAWSPHDRFLASCSIDNTVIVWDAQAFPNIVAVLKGHTGLVKGVAWDPVGKFLASQSDDRSVKIWRTRDWTCSNTITEPFEECGGTTHILRLSWSPDGQYLVSAHAMNGGGPTAQIIEREGWKCDKDFVGHRKAVTCVRFHSAILRSNAAKTNKPQQYCCLAVGSRDRSLSVWMTALQRPLVVIRELFNDSILDLSWGPDKCILMACSGDGTVACLQFDSQELGTPLSEEDRNAIYQRIYGKSAVLANGNNDAGLLIENPELLDISLEKIKPPNLLLGPPNQNTTTSSALPTNGFSSLLSSAKAPLSVQTALTPTPPLTATFPSEVTQSSEFFDAASSNLASPIKAINKQTEVRRADGKRRITPMFIPLNQDVSDSSTTQFSSSSRPMNNTSNATTIIPPSTITTSTASVEMEIPATSGANKPLIAPAEDPLYYSRRLDPRLTISEKNLPAQLDLEALKSFPTAFKKKSSPADTPPSNGSVLMGTPYQASTSGPKINITPTTKCEFFKMVEDYRVLVQNGNVQTLTGMLCKVTAWSLKSSTIMWHVFIGSPVVNLNLCPKNVILCSLDGTLRIFNMVTGVAVLPIISLSTTSVQCAFCPHGKYVGVITECGLLRIWDTEKACAVLATGCSEVLGKFGPVFHFSITELGIPFVLFANGNSYMYSAQMQSWLVLNTKDPVFRHGLYTTMPREFNKNFHAYPLLSVQGSINNYIASLNTVDVNDNEWQSVSKIYFIENQIKLCELVKSEGELRHWYVTLAYQLACNGDERRLRLLLDDLLGPANGCVSREELEERKVLSISKLSLFESVLKILKLQVKYQRLYMEYKDLYSNITPSSSASSSSSCPDQPDKKETEILFI